VDCTHFTNYITVTKRYRGSILSNRPTCIRERHTSIKLHQRHDGSERQPRFTLSLTSTHPFSPHRNSFTLQMHISLHPLCPSDEEFLGRYALIGTLAKLLVPSCTPNIWPPNDVHILDHYLRRSNAKMQTS